MKTILVVVSAAVLLGFVSVGWAANPSCPSSTTKGSGLTCDLAIGSTIMVGNLGYGTTNGKLLIGAMAPPSSTIAAVSGGAGVIISNSSSNCVVKGRTHLKNLCCYSDGGIRYSTGTTPGQDFITLQNQSNSTVTLSFW